MPTPALTVSRQHEQLHDRLESERADVKALKAKTYRVSMEMERLLRAEGHKADADAVYAGMAGHAVSEDVQQRIEAHFLRLVESGELEL